MVGVSFPNPYFPTHTPAIDVEEGVELLLFFEHADAVKNRINATLAILKNFMLIRFKWLMILIEKRWNYFVAFFVAYQVPSLLTLFSQVPLKRLCD